MQRLVVLLVLVFAFASVAGATTAHAHRYVSMPLIVLNHVDDDNRPIPVVVQVQRGEIDLGAGIMLPCGPHQAIEVQPLGLLAAPRCAEPVPTSQTPGHPGPDDRLLRPPKRA